MPLILRIPIHGIGWLNAPLKTPIIVSATANMRASPSGMSPIRQTVWKLGDGLSISVIHRHTCRQGYVLACGSGSRAIIPAVEQFVGRTRKTYTNAKIEGG